MFFEEVERLVHKIIGLLHLTVDSEDLPTAIDHTTSDEMCINFDNTLHAYGSIFQVLGNVTSHRDRGLGKAFCSSRKSRGGVVEGKASSLSEPRGSDATKHQSKYTKQETANASLPGRDYSIIRIIFGEEPTCAEN
jgi:hypothetical protein